MAAFDPGPWFVVQQRDGWTIQDRPGGCGRCIARQSEESPLGNAHLIAAAPLLVQQLRRDLDHFRTYAALCREYGSEGTAREFDRFAREVESALPAAQSPE